MKHVPLIFFLWKIDEYEVFTHTPTHQHTYSPTHLLTLTPTHPHPYLPTCPHSHSSTHLLTPPHQCGVQGTSLVAVWVLCRKQCIWVNYEWNINASARLIKRSKLNQYTNIYLHTDRTALEWYISLCITSYNCLEITFTVHAISLLRKLDVNA